jgi:acetyl esterase/lipase
VTHIISNLYQTLQMRNYMKRNVIILALCTMSLICNAAIIWDETFNYTVSNLALETSWTTPAPSPTVNPTSGVLTTGTGKNIGTPALTYSNSGGSYILSGIGKTIRNDYSAGADYKSYKPFSSTPVTNGILYLTFIYNAGVSQAQVASEVFGLATGTSSGPKVWVGKGITANTYRFCTTRASTSSADYHWGPTEFSDVNATILVVLKYDFSTNVSSVYLNPVIGGTEPATPEVSDGASSTFRTSLNNLWFRNTGSSVSKFSVSGARVSSTWSEAVAAAATGTILPIPAVGIASGITTTGFTANWTPVLNATGYDIRIYQGATLISTTRINGQSSSSLAITGLTQGTSYTFKVIAKGDGSTLSDSPLSDPSAMFSTVGGTVIDYILTDLGDGSWGTIATTAFATGEYPSSTVNGYNLVKTYIYTGSLTCTAGETHTNRILLGKNTENAAIEFPPLKTVGAVEIHAATGTAGNSFRLEEWVNNQWQLIGTYTTIKSPDSIYTIPFARNTDTKLRIANNTSSGLYIYKIRTRTLQETLDLNVQNSSPVENEVCFSNLKKSITLTFNKNVTLASGTILLNDISIPLSDCIITNNLVCIPVTLTAFSLSNKSYTLTVSDGAFAEATNLTNLSKKYVVNFQTLKSVDYPANYNGLLDVVYKNVNSANCRMDIYYPTNATNPVPVVINMHGGGWNHGTKEEQGGFSMYFNMGYAVANVEYRMTGEAKAPAAVEDIRGAMVYLLNHAAELHINKNKIIFQGASAGGHLALIGGYLRNNKIYDNDCTPYSGDFNIMAVIDKYGPSDLPNFMFYGSLVDWLGIHATDAPYIQTLSPLAYVDANTPPTYIIHGDADPTVPYTQSVTLQGALQAAGVKNKFTTVPGGGHGGFSDTYNTQMETEITTFLNEVNSFTTNVIPTSGTNAIKIKLSGTQIYIDSPEEICATVFDYTGKALFQTQNKTFTISQSGIFIIKTKNQHSESVFKVFVH